MTTARSPHRTLRLLLAALLVLVALLVLGARSAAAAPAASQKATKNCWLAVINDWLDNNRVDHTYPIPCYSQAIQHLSQYPDVAGYSSAEDDIHRAELAAIHHQPPPGSGSHGNGTSNAGPGGGNGNGNNNNNNSTGGGTNSAAPAKSKGVIKEISGWLGPGNAQSIPLPLLVLGGLALLLLFGALATWLIRRFQARRVTPAPAPAPVVPKRR